MRRKSTGLSSPATLAVKDFRIDFEDGFGARSDGEEDAAAGDRAPVMAWLTRAASRLSSLMTRRTASIAHTRAPARRAAPNGLDAS